MLKQIRIGTKKTFDASATPVSGGKTISRQLAPVDIEELKGSLEATIEEVKENDPKELKKQIAELKKEVAKKQPVVHVPAVVKDNSAQLQSAFARTLKKERESQIKYLNDLLGKFKLSYSQVKGVKSFGDVIDLALIIGTDITGAILGQIKSLETSIPELPAALTTFKMHVQPEARNGGSTKVTLYTQTDYTHNGSLSKPERAILSVLAQHQDKMNGRRKIAILSGYSVKSGSFNNSLSKLRVAGYLAGSGDDLKITQLGIDTLGSYEPLPTGEALWEYWYNKLSKPEGMILQALIYNHPNAMNRAQIAVATGYSDTSGSFNNSLSKLRTLELIDGYKQMKAAESLFE